MTGAAGFPAGRLLDANAAALHGVWRVLLMLLITVCAVLHRLSHSPTHNLVCCAIAVDI
jgi:hypothetical protein